MKHLAELAGKRGCCKRGMCIHKQAAAMVASIDRLRDALWDIHGDASDAATYTDVSASDAVVNIRDKAMAALNNE